MKKQTVVKIDLCKSKIFNREQEEEFPKIRSVTLDKLLDISTKRFPYGDEKYPKGSFYKQEGDAVYFILDKPTVAIRSAIEFMKEWYYNGLKHSFPECRVIIHRGMLEKTHTPAGDDFLGKVFEDIAAVEKTLDDGKIFVSDNVRKNADRTITKFVYYTERKVIKDDKVKLYYLAFSDPRTFENDALAHLLFIAHKESAKTRDQIISFFIVQYILEEGPLSDFAKFENWSKQKEYPLLPKEKIKSLLENRDLFVKGGASEFPMFHLAQEKKDEFLKAQDQYNSEVKIAVQIVEEEITKVMGTNLALKGFAIREIMDEYLCGIFSEIRMIANYFRDTTSFYDSDAETFKRYDYILDRHLVDIDNDIANKWKAGFISGLKKLTEKESYYISAIFHNILAGYYLNRSLHSSSYQIEKLQKRNIFLDTNVLYSLRCRASNFHEKVKYFSERLSAIGLNFKLYPFSVSEFENSLEKVEIEYKKCPNSYKLINWNPWLYQEFRANPHKYLNDISTCKLIFSVAKGKAVCEENFHKINKELGKNNITLETSYETFSEEEKEILWEKLRSLILSKTGDMEDYWGFSEKLDIQQKGVIEHDVNLMENVRLNFSKLGEDELGPLVLLITHDSKLLKCRKEYPFVISVEQFLEFMMPYLFLSEIPETDPNGFPNQILSAHLGIHTSYWKPNNKDIITMFFSDPDLFKQECVFGSNISTIAKTLSMDRLGEIVKNSENLPEDEQNKLAQMLAKKVEDAIIKNTEKAFGSHKLKSLEEKLEKEKTEKEKYKTKSEKLRRTLKYYKRVKREQ